MSSVQLLKVRQSSSSPQTRIQWEKPPPKLEISKKNIHKINLLKIVIEESVGNEYQSYWNSFLRQISKDFWFPASDLGTPTVEIVGAQGTDLNEDTMLNWFFKNLHPHPPRAEKNSIIPVGSR